jgi:hypothetical protein
MKIKTRYVLITCTFFYRSLGLWLALKLEIMIIKYKYKYKYSLLVHLCSIHCLT